MASIDYYLSDTSKAVTVGFTVGVFSIRLKTGFPGARD